MLVEGFEMLKKYNIPVPKYVVNRLPKKGELRFPLVIKADMYHKTDKDAVILGIRDYNDLSINYYKIKEKFPNKDIIIQEQITGHFIETIIGIKRDSVFDYIVLFGIGGIYTEIIKDFLIMVPPFYKEDFFNLINNLKLRSILLGYRNLPKVNLDMIFNIIKSLERLFNEKNLKEIEINPLIAKEKEVYAVDVRFSV